MDKRQTGHKRWNLFSKGSVCRAKFKTFCLSSTVLPCQMGVCLLRRCWHLSQLIICLSYGGARRVTAVITHRKSRRVTLPSPNVFQSRKTSKSECLQVGELIYYFNRIRRVWVTGVVKESVSPSVYIVSLENGNQIIKSLKPRERKYIPSYYQTKNSNQSPNQDFDQ